MDDLSERELLLILEGLHKLYDPIWTADRRREILQITQKVRTELDYVQRKDPFRSRYNAMD